MTMKNVGLSMHSRERRSAFTLVELLVVLAIITLLISILLPGLAEAVKISRMLREQAACRSQLQGWHTYAATYKDGMIIPGIPWSWAHPNNPSRYYEAPPDLVNGGAPGASVVSADPSDGPVIAANQFLAAGFDDRQTTGRSEIYIEGSCIKVWPLRFWGWVEYTARSLQIDARTYNTFWARSKTPTATQMIGNSVVNTYDSGATFQGSLAWHPTFGLNSLFMGGHYRFGAYPNATAMQIGTNSGQFFTRKTVDIKQTEKVIIMGSARSYDLINSSMAGAGYGGGAVPPGASPAIVPGHHMILPPNRGSVPSSSSTPNWVASDVFNPNSNPLDWGFIDARHKNKAATGMADGHVEMQSLRQLRDMRKWSDKATGPNWVPTTN